MKRIAAVIISVLSLLPLGAERRDSIIVSLMTCWPGPEVYELCGHEAIRTRTADGDRTKDSVWNYGVFDFAEPNFVYRFVKGETDYMLAGCPTGVFMAEYMSQGRRVVEQELNLTQDEARALLANLQREALPQNRTYRYNYVKDNCATRILDRIDEVAGERVVYPDSVRYGTFRNAMRAYHTDYPWYQFGIDLALGAGIDYNVTGREEMFAPLEMMHKAEGAHFADGTPLVRSTRVLYDGEGDATLGPTPWYFTPLFLSWVLFALSVITVCLQWRRKRIFRLIYSVWFALLGLTGCVLSFLVFISSHEATSPNLLILWLNPLQFIVAIGVWFGRRGRIPTLAMVYCDIIVLALLMIAWPMQTQSANPAFFPLTGMTLLLAVAYAIISQKISYNNNRNTRRNEEVCNLGADGSRHVGRGRTGGIRKTTTRGGNRR